MSTWSVVAVLLSAGLVVAPVPRVAPTSTVAVTPCPHVTPVTIPPTPTPPARDPRAPAIGGDQLGTSGLATPQGVASPPALSAMSWVVADLDTGAVLGACAPHLQRRPASVLKLLLADTTLPRLDPNQVVTATAEDLKIPANSSAVGMIVGGHYPVSTLWYGLLLESGNDTANALARVVGGAGGWAAGVAAMNAEAHRLGADDTHASTPSGLDADGQFTSPYDLALIARADFAQPDFAKYDTALRFQWPAQPPHDPRGFQIQNENSLLTSYPGALGGKTGFTDQARHTYVGAAQRGGRRLVVTLMGAEIVPARAWKQGAMLLDWGFKVPAQASVGHLVTPDEAARLHSPPSPAKAAPGGTSRALGAAEDTISVPLTAIVAIAVVVLLVAGGVGVLLLRRPAYQGRKRR